MRFWAAPLIISLALAMFVACGDETTSVTETPAMSVVESGKKMVVCSDDNAGDIVYVKDSSAVFYCADGEWQTLNGKDGADGKDGKNGADGKDGADGKEGAKGQDGSSVKDTVVIRDTIFVNERDTVILLSYDTLVVINRDTVYIQEPASSSSDISSSSQITEVPEGYMRDSRDGRLYKTVQIGNQLWMAENMKLDVNDAYCYNDNKENCEKYGMFYTSTTAKRVCPEGWELPSEYDWDALLYNLTDYFGESDPYQNVAVISKLKSSIGWNSINGNDSLGFSAYPAGLFSKNGFFTDFGNRACFNGKVKRSGSLEYTCLKDDKVVVSLSTSLSEAMPIRCLKTLPLDTVYGKCDSASDGIMSFDSRYVCANLNWRKTSPLEKEIGTCSSKNEGEVKNGYTCSSGVWYGSLIDSRDGKTYKTVMIGNQTWMAENLDYDSPNSHSVKYGREYPLESLDVLTACPDGWHIPDRSEWETLTTVVGNESIAGKILKSSIGYDDECKGVDLYGFSILSDRTKDMIRLYPETIVTTYSAGSGITPVTFFCGDFVDLYGLEPIVAIRCIKDDETANLED